jgi:hypothetical protein
MRRFATDNARLLQQQQMARVKKRLRIQAYSGVWVPENSQSRPLRTADLAGNVISQYFVKMLLRKIQNRLSDWTLRMVPVKPAHGTSIIIFALQ